MRLWLLLALSSVAFAGAPCTNGPTPCYSEAGIVNSADYLAGELAPNSIASIFGTGLSYTTRGVSQQDLEAGLLPTTLIGTGVHVIVEGIAAPMLYVSPKQINFIVPSILLPGPVQVQVVLDGNAGPPITITLKPAAPALFQFDAKTVAAIHPDGTAYTWDGPAHAWDWVILYATGLGQTVPPAGYREIPQEAAPIENASHLKVLLNGVAVDPRYISYAGAAPGYAGLNQINFKLPPNSPENPEIQISLESVTSQPGAFLPAKP